MDPGEYRTNVLSFNNFASIKYEYLEPDACYPGPARKPLQRAEAAWRQAGKLVHHDTLRDGIWVFQNTNASNSSADRPGDNGIVTENGIGEAQGVQLVVKAKGIFEPASLIRSKQATPALYSASSNSSPSSSLENPVRNAQALNARSVSANALLNPSLEPSATSPGLKSPNKTEDMWPLMKDVHENFISAALGSLVYLLCRDEGFIPLNPRTLISGYPKSPDKTWPQGANATTLATLDISLTSLGTLVIKAHSDAASGLQGLVNDSAAADKLAPGAALWLAPGGNAAKYYSQQDDKAKLLTAPASSVTSDSRPITLDGATFKTWQSNCLEWLSAKGIHTAPIESGGWILVQILVGHSPYLNAEYQGIPILEGRTVVPWPAALCFQTASSGTLPASEKPISGNRDPLAFSEEWYSGKDDRAALILKRQKERQVAEALSIEQAEVEARALQSGTFSPAVLRRGSNAGAMYPTPPDAIHHTVGVTPSFDGAGSTPGNVNPFNIHDGTMTAPTNSGMSENDVDMWASAEKKERTSLNPHFNDNDNDADNLFGDLGGDLFGTADITEADFNFFDEPDDVQPTQMTGTPGPSNVITAQETLAFEDPFSLNSAKENGMGPPNAIVRNQNNQDTTDPSSEQLEASRMQVAQIGTKNFMLENTETSSSCKQGKPSSAPVKPNFNQEYIYQQLVKELDTGAPKTPARKASLFNKINFENTLSSVDKKYGAHGQYTFTGDKKHLKPLDALGIPQTEYLNARRRVPINEQESANLARVLVEENVAGPPESTDPMDFLMDSDCMSQVSEQDDSSLTAEDTVSKNIVERNWLGDNGSGDSISASFDAMAMDFEQSASTPQSVPGSQMLLFDADPADWSLTTYFTTPEPEVQSDTLSDLERIATAQILADQAVSGTLQLPRISGSESPTPVNKTTITRGLVRTLAKVAKVLFEDITPCTMRSFLEIQGIPVLNQGLRLPPRPMNPRAPNTPDPARSNNPFSLPPPQLELRRSDSKLSILPAAVRFWDNLGLAPSMGGKDVNAVCIFPDIAGVSTNANTFLEQMKSSYESYRLGNHDRATSKDIVDGLIPFSVESDHQDGPRYLATLQETVARLSRALCSLTVEEKNFVVYFVYPVDSPTLLVHICSAFQHLFNLYRKALADKKMRASNELVLQLIPGDFVASPTSIVVPLPSEYARLALEVYDRCVDFTSSTSSPAIMLEQPLPKSIDFKLSPYPSPSLLQENTCLHIAYAQSIDDRWVAAVWTDNRGTQQMTASYCLGRKSEPLSMHFSEVAHEIWETTLDFISSKKIHWRIMIARVGVMDPSEVDFWTGLAATESDAHINLTLIAVQTDPSLRLLPPSVTLTISGNGPQAVTPVSTPQSVPSIMSPDNSTTPARETANAATPGDAPVEPDRDARLIDYTDQSWGAVLSHRLNNSNSLLELNPALISGYLIKRGGTYSDDTPIVIEVNIVHSEVVGNPRTFHESLLREILGYYRGLATLARVRGMVDPVKDGRPWHIAAAEKAVKTLYMLM
ncbi:uncharacterized protein BP5553_04511 [Venustampulla echinocandica]|uniref:Mediator of RNA polymerase II transcription subunit 13 n=1 Tax=Venustampulla echinocandica TaxID=2656787 RepID=A0A370TNI3_9HELO|nr:uncharacterized protein BP5553_04511 [Venustampulla echinocandica]RDL37078.1 hypothetical protein BP5553_04511 [Venustampulla echinocandica]